MVQMVENLYVQLVLVWYFVPVIISIVQISTCY